MPRYSASRFAGIRWSDPVTLPLHVGSAAAGDGGGAEEDLATGGAPSLSMTPSAKRTRFSPFRRSFPPRGRLSEEEEEEEEGERHGRRDAGSSEAGASSSRLGLAKRRREKRTREPESAMAVAAASAPMDEEEEEDMVVVVAGWVSVEGWLAGRWLT